MKARGERPPGAVGLDGDGAEARHLHHLDGAAVPVPRPRRQPARHPRPPRLLRGHLPGAGRRRRRDHGARRREGHRAPDPQAVRGVPRPAACPLLTFVNKWDRPGPDAPRAARRDRVAARPRRHAGHLAGRHRRRLPRPRRPPQRRLRPLHPRRPAAPARPARSSLDADARRGGRRLARPPRRAARAARRRRRTTSTSKLFRGRRATPGLLRLRPHQLRRAPAARRASSTWRRRPQPRPDVDGEPRPLDDPFSAFVFKVQANMDPPTATASRSSGSARAASSGAWSSPTAAPASPSPPSTPTRCSARSARPSTRPSPATSSASSTPPRSGSATRSTSTRRSSSPASRLRARALRHRPGPRHRPVQAVPLAASPSSTRRAWCRCCATRDLGDQAPMLAAVGQMQFEVAIGPARARVRRAGRADPRPATRSPGVTDEASAPSAARHERACGCSSGPTARCSRCSSAPTGSQRVEADQPELRLDRLVAEGMAG